MAKLQLTGSQAYLDIGDQSCVALHQGRNENDLIVEGVIKGGEYEKPYNINGISIIEARNCASLLVHNYTYINRIDVNFNSSVTFSNYFNFGDQKLELNVINSSKFANEHQFGGNSQDLNLSSLSVGVKSQVIFKQDGYQYELKTQTVSVEVPDVSKFCTQYKYMRNLYFQKVLTSDQALIHEAFKINSGIKIDIINKKTQSLIIEIKKIEGENLIDSGFFDHAELLPQEITTTGEDSTLPSQYYS